jgi:IS605 OrfB family transposase
MKLIRTTIVKLNTSEEDFKILQNTMSTFTDQYNFCCSVGFDNHIRNSIDIHKLTYQQCRKFLPSQLAVSARTLAASSLASEFSQMRKRKFNRKGQEIVYHAPHSKCMPILLDRNSHTLYSEKLLLSILTCSGRRKISFNNNPQFANYLKDNWKHSSASLYFNNRKQKFYLLVQFEKDIEDISPNGKTIGIDRGIRNIAVTSDNHFYSGGSVKHNYYRKSKLVSKLHEVNTKSAKRHLRRIRGAEHRFKADTNHCISKNIVSNLNTGDTIVLEDLSRVKEKDLNKMSPKLRQQITSWSFYQLETFIKYKAEAKGIAVEFVDPKYTSQRCSCCGYIDKENRKGSEFYCKGCGYRLDSDLNASRNIVSKHLDPKGFYKKPCGSNRAKSTSLSSNRERS